jgi:GNAT superfamily N-acetyltransferase
MGFLADKCIFRLLTRELIQTCKPFSCGYDDLGMRRYPAVLIGRLGVNLLFANKGIGTELMQIIKFWFVEPDNKAAVRYLAVDTLNNPRTLNYYEKNGFSFLFKDEEQESISSNMKQPLKTRYMYFDLIEVLRK